MAIGGRGGMRRAALAMLAPILSLAVLPACDGLWPTSDDDPGDRHVLPTPSGITLVIAGGDAQVGYEHTRTGEPVTVLVTRHGAGSPGQIVRFTVTGGDATVRHETRTTDAAGLAGTYVMLGGAGVIRIEASVYGADDVAFTLEAVVDDRPYAYTFQIVAEYPHATDAYTQGLEVDAGELFEGTGLWGGSSLRRVDLATGQVLQQINLPSTYFGEGIAVLDQRIVQLTWQSQIGFVYDRESFDLLDTFTYPHEGWGITHDGEYFLVTDGTSRLRFWDSGTLDEVSFVTVTENGSPLSRLNESEFVNGDLFVNVYLTTRIARVNPWTGEVTGILDLDGIFDHMPPGTSGVANGIAYDGDGERLIITGKRWPKMFRIEMVPIGG